MGLRRLELQSTPPVNAVTVSVEQAFIPLFFWSPSDADSGEDMGDLLRHMNSDGDLLAG